MATSSDDTTKVELTTCSICFETFKKPKHFTCLHSFCEGCIHTYIKTTYEQRKGGIHCPLCRLFVSKPEDVSIEEWSARLPTNHILVSLIDMNESKSGQKLCTACSRENETESACSWCINCSESLCEACDRAHRRNKFTSGHNLVGIETSPTTELQMNHADIPCTEHPDKKVEAYCSDHSVVCCMTCALLKHRKCENVGSVEDAAEQKKKSKEIQEFAKDLENIEQSLSTMVKERDENLNKFDNDIENMKAEVNRLFTRISDHLNRKKTDIMTEISKIEKEVRPEIEDKRDEIKLKTSMIENDLALFQTNMKYAPPAQFIQAMDKLIEQKDILEKIVKDQGKEIKEVEVTFEANKKLLGMEKEINAFGKLNIRRSRIDKFIDTSSVVPAPSAVIDTQSSVTGITVLDTVHVVPSLSAVIDTQSSVTGITVLDTGHVVLTQNNRKTIELRDQVCTTVLSSFQVPGYPWGIKRISGTSGAVSVQRYGLVIFNVQNNLITKINEIRTSVDYDFAYHQDKYYVGYEKNISVFDRSLRKARVISVNNMVGLIALRDENSLCYTSLNKVHCVTMDGSPVFEYSHVSLKSPYGIAVHQSRHIFVCGYSSKNVHQLNHDGKLQRIIIENLPSGPFCISFNIQGDRAVVGCDGKIAIYNLK